MVKWWIHISCMYNVQVSTMKGNVTILYYALG